MKTVWYLCAVNDDPATNEYLVHVIGQQNTECQCSNVLCADDKRRNLFRCPNGYSNVRSAVSAIGEFNLKIEVFKEEIERVIMHYNLWKPSARKAARRKIVSRRLLTHA